MKSKGNSRFKVGRLVRITGYAEWGRHGYWRIEAVTDQKPPTYVIGHEIFSANQLIPATKLYAFLYT